MTTLHRQAGKSRRAFALFAVIAYTLAMGIVPAGHMAAPIASGTAFHLCPGDLRSAQIIGALTALSPSAPQQQHHHGHHGHHGNGDQSAATADALADNEAVDSGACPLGSAGNAKLVADAAPAIDSTALPPIYLASRPASTPVPAQRWLRPPVRTPPA